MNVFRMANSKKEAAAFRPRNGRETLGTHCFQTMLQCGRGSVPELSDNSIIQNKAWGCKCKYSCNTLGAT